MTAGSGKHIVSVLLLVLISLAATVMLFSSDNGSPSARLARRLGRAVDSGTPSPQANEGKDEDSAPPASSSRDHSGNRVPPILVVSFGHLKPSTPTGNLLLHIHQASVKHHIAVKYNNTVSAMRFVGDAESCKKWRETFSSSRGDDSSFLFPRVEWLVLLPDYYLVGEKAPLEPPRLVGLSEGYDALLSLRAGQHEQNGDIVWLNASSVLAVKAMATTLEAFCSERGTPPETAAFGKTALKNVQSAGGRVGETMVGYAIDCKTPLGGNLNLYSKELKPNAFPYTEALVGFPQASCGMPLLHINAFLHNHLRGLHDPPRTPPKTASSDKSVAVLTLRTPLVTRRSVSRILTLRQFSAATGASLNLVNNEDEVEGAVNSLFDAHEWVLWVDKSAFAVGDGKPALEEALAAAKASGMWSSATAVLAKKAHATALVEAIKQAKSDGVSLSSTPVLATIPPVPRVPTTKPGAWHVAEDEIVWNHLKEAISSIPSGTQQVWALAEAPSPETLDMVPTAPNVAKGGGKKGSESFPEQKTAAGSRSGNVGLISLMPTYRADPHARITADLHLWHLQYLRSRPEGQWITSHDVVQCNVSSIDSFRVDRFHVAHSAVDDGAPSGLFQQLARLLLSSEYVVGVNSAVFFNNTAGLSALIDNPSLEPGSMQPFSGRKDQLALFVIRRPANEAQQQELQKKLLSVDDMMSKCNKENELVDLKRIFEEKAKPIQPLPPKVAAWFSPMCLTAWKKKGIYPSYKCNPEVMELITMLGSTVPRADFGVELQPFPNSGNGPFAMASVREYAKKGTSGMRKSPTGARFGMLSLFSAKHATLDAISMWIASKWNKQQYASLNGYDAIWEGGAMHMPGRTRHWDKVPAIIKWLPHYEWLWYLDTDTVIMNTSITLDAIVKEATRRNCGKTPNVILVNEPVGTLNSGSILLRNAPQTFEFLRAMVRVDCHVWEHYEQGAVNFLAHNVPRFSGPMVPLLGVVFGLGYNYSESTTAFDWNCSSPDATTPDSSSGASPTPSTSGFFTSVIPMRMFNAMPPHWHLIHGAGMALQPMELLAHFVDYKNRARVGASAAVYEEYMLWSIVLNRNFSRWPPSLP